MNLTNDQLKAVEAGVPVPVLLDSTKCVLLREDVYDRLRQVTSDVLDADTVYSLIEEVMADDDANDPALQSYQKYKQ
jgi:hypothetical protein